jgi:serine/threonine-protein kinase
LENGPAESPFYPGRIIKNRFRLDQRLGEAGCLEAYRAYDLLLSRNVALKALRQELAAEEPHRLGGALLAAARRSARIGHPGLVEVIDFGREGEVPFVVEEAPEGALLSDKLAERKKMSLKGFLSFALRAAEALQGLHEGGGVHGDIRADKVLLLPGGGVKLAESGYPRLDSEGRPSIPAPGPEGQASDLHDLGALFYRCLTGNDLDPSLLAGEHPTPRLNLGEEAPPNVARIIEKALSRGERARFKDAGEMRKEIEAALLRESPMDTAAGLRPQEEGREGPATPLGIARRWWIAGLAALALLAAALTAWLVVLPLLRTKAEVPNLVRKNVEEARREAESRGFRFKEGALEYSSSFEKGRVVSQSPQAGKRVPEGTEIVVVVSGGALTVPYLRGLLLNDAKAALQKAGLQVGEVLYEDTDEYKPGVVLRSDPAEGTVLSGGAKVDLVVSR